jgi:hypothetical protein
VQVAVRFLVWVATIALVAITGLAVAPAATVGAAGAVHYTNPVFVDQTKAGGEPLIWHSSKFGDLVYSSHEGTTHLDRSGLPSSSAGQFVCPDPTRIPPECYSNHVWIWTSDDHGATWQPRDQGLLFPGFSDPDLTEDAGGNIYDTGIDLVNDATYSSPDGGKTWPTGTFQCHAGDRPWLAGGRAGEMFMSTDPNTGSHTVFFSNTAGASCLTTGRVDAGSYQGGTFSGFGKLVYDPVNGSIIEPAQFQNSDGTFGVGVSVLPDAANAFLNNTGAFQPQEVVHDTSVFSPFGAPNIVVIDSAENLYFAWDTDDREAANTTNGCGTLPNMPGGPTPKPNHINFVAGRHIGPNQWQFLPPVSLETFGPARIGGARVQWPWSVVGSPGNVSVVWYQLDQLVDPDCDLAAADGKPAPGVKTYIYEAHISDALNPATRKVTVTNASGRAVHEGGICNSGTTCAATGQDRRLGDYFTNHVDGNGCVLIASGDTTVPDQVTGGPRITSLPIFLAQNSGPSLTGKDCGASSAAAVPVASATPASLPGTYSRPELWPILAMLAAALLALLVMGRKPKRD